MTRGDKSTEVIDISDTSSDDDFGNKNIALQPEAPSSSASNRQNQHSASSHISTPNILIIDSTDSDDLNELETLLGYVDLGKDTIDSNPTSHAARTQQPPRPKASRLDSEEKRSIVSLAAHPKTIKNAQGPTKRVLKLAIQTSEESDGLHEEASESTESKRATKAQMKLQRDINKLVTDKKSTLKDFTVEIAYSLQEHAFVLPLKSKLATYNGNISFFEPPSDVQHLIRFRRRHIAHYNSTLKEWMPVEPYTRLEDLYVIFFSAELLVRSVSEDSLIQSLSALRRSHGLTSHSQIFLMVDEVNGYYKRKGTHHVKRDVMESAMASLQATERCFIVHVDGPEDASQWLFNITSDLGIKPHKRIRDSFLPFCTDTKIKCGSSKADTYKKMLQQIRGVTESAADGIFAEVPTLRCLFEGYSQEHDIEERHHRLKEVIISNRKDGAAKSRALNQALSKKVHDVIWGEDPLMLV